MEESMEDDDLADRAQQLLDALDATLRNTKFVSQLDPDDLKSIRANRDRVFAALGLYRKLNYITERRSIRPLRVPAGLHQRMPVPMAVPAMMAAPAALGAGTAVVTGGGTAVATGGSGALLLLGQILLPIVAAFLVSEAISKATGGTLQDSATRSLTDAVNKLARDLLELGTVSTVMALTAAEAARLPTDELLKKLIKAANIRGLAARAAISTVQIIIAELMTRLPECVAAIVQVRDTIVKLNRFKGNPSLLGPRGLVIIAATQKALVEALDALQDCIEGSNLRHMAGVPGFSGN
jgi:hypothetical protein